MKNLLTYIALAISALIVGYSLWATSQKVIANEPQVPILETSTNLEVKMRRPYNTDRVEELVNIKREAFDLLSLEHEEKLCSYTQKRLDDMEEGFSHSGFINTSDSFLESYRPQITVVGENLADFELIFSDEHTESDIVDAWYASPSHLKNIIDKKYTHTCVRCDTRFCVQIFAGF